MSAHEHTPEFLTWTLAVPCPLRQGSHVHSPGMTERHLRALRTAGEAFAEQRVVHGIGLSRTDGSPNAERLGFRIDEALTVYGGLAAAETHCPACPANAARTLGLSTLAGCVGELPRTFGDVLDWANLVDAAVAQLHLAADLERLFPVTNPRWYGLWMPPATTPQQLALLAPLWSECVRLAAPCPPAALLLKEALGRAESANLPLCVELHPPARADAAGNWLIPASCPKCRAVWRENSPRCLVCGWLGHRVGARRRKLRGRRPYRPLREFLRDEEVASLLHSQHGNPSE